MKFTTVSDYQSDIPAVLPAIQIGEFTISNFLDGTVWIEDDFGDAMEVSEASLELAIKEFFNANF